MDNIILNSLASPSLSALAMFLSSPTVDLTIYLMRRPVSMNACWISRSVEASLFPLATVMTASTVHRPTIHGYLFAPYRSFRIPRDISLFPRPPWQDASFLREYLSTNPIFRQSQAIVTKNDSGLPLNRHRAGPWPFYFRIQMIPWYQSSRKLTRDRLMFRAEWGSSQWKASNSPDFIVWRQDTPWDISFLVEKPS